MLALRVVAGRSWNASRPGRVAALEPKDRPLIVALLHPMAGAQSVWVGCARDHGDFKDRRVVVPPFATVLTEFCPDAESRGWAAGLYRARVGEVQTRFAVYPTGRPDKLPRDVAERLFELS